MFLRLSLGFILLSICVIQHSLAETGTTRIALLGLTGAGKSSLANTITNSSEFSVSGGARSETKKCKLVSTTRNGLSVSVVDTPGFFDTDLKFTNFQENLIEFLNLTLPGPHVVLYVQQAGHYTKQDVEGINNYLNMFGDAILPFTVFVFTKVDCTEHEYMQDLHPELKKIVDKCNSRYVFLPRMDKKQEMDDKIGQLFDIVRDMLMENKNQHYTNSMYKTQQEVIATKLKNQRLKEEEEKKREQDAIKAKEEARLKKEQDKKIEEARLAEEALQKKERERQDEIRKAETQTLELKKQQELVEKQQERIRQLQQNRKRHRPLIKIGPIKLL